MRPTKSYRLRVAAIKKKSEHTQVKETPARSGEVNQMDLSLRGQKYKTADEVGHNNLSLVRRKVTVRRSTESQQCRITRRRQQDNTEIRSNDSNTDEMSSQHGTESGWSSQVTYHPIWDPHETGTQPEKPSVIKNKLKIALR